VEPCPGEDRNTAAKATPALSLRQVANDFAAPINKTPGTFREVVWGRPAA
jgi:hypothetical protein